MAAKASTKTASTGNRSADLESAIAAITKSFGEGPSCGSAPRART